MKRDCLKISAVNPDTYSQARPSDAFLAMTSFTVTYRRRELSSVGGWFVGLILSFFSSSVVEVGC